MEPQQVFRAYDAADAPPDAAYYCLACGGALSDRDDGEGVRRACGSCGFVHYRNPAPAVSVLIADGERVVLCRRRPAAFEGGRWCLPCGYVEFEEDYLIAARREVEEETGLLVELESILSVTSNFLRPRIHTVVVVLLARAIGGELRPGDDVDHVCWFSHKEDLPDLAFEADRHIIRRYFATHLGGAPLQVS